MYAAEKVQLCRKPPFLILQTLKEKTFNIQPMYYL